MKRIMVAAGLAVAALSLPATAALADGYERKHVAKPKPKAKAHAKAKHHKKHHAAPKKHHRYQEHVVDYAKMYGGHHQVVHVSKHVEESRSYYEERDGHVVAHHGSYVNPAQGCQPSRPCTWGYGASRPPVVSPGWGWWGHPGGVGYGVDGGYHGQSMYIVPGGGWSTQGAYSAGHASAMAQSHAYSSGHHMGGGHGGNVIIVRPQHGPMHPGGHGGGHHPKPGHHGRGW